MTEHKFTDEEVIKALECCVNGTSEACLKCAFGLTPPYPVCKTVVEKYALGLINRQRAEIKSLGKVLHELKQEAEMVYKQRDALRCQVKNAEQTRAEAIKEFAERLKEGHDQCDGEEDVPWLIDKLVKEMMEEKQ